jgi:HSP20 family protein
MAWSQYSLIPQNIFSEEPFPLLRSMRRAMESALSDVLEPSESVFSPREFYPRVAVREDERQIQVQAELPGMKESDVEITYEPGYLILKGEKKEEERRESRSGLTSLSECRYGRFERRVPLRVDVEEEQIQANFDRGVLTVSLPKTAEVRAQARKIPIKLGAPPQLEQAAGKGRAQPSSEAHPSH